MPDLGPEIALTLQGNQALFGPPPGTCSIPSHPPTCGAPPWPASRACSRIWSRTPATSSRTFARIWFTLVTGSVGSKDTAAGWALERLPEGHRGVLHRARELYLEGADDDWTAARRPSWHTPRTSSPRSSGSRGPAGPSRRRDGRMRYDVYAWAAPRDISPEDAAERIDRWEARGGAPSDAPFEPSSDVAGFYRELEHDLRGMSGFEVVADAEPHTGRGPVWLQTDPAPPAHVAAIRLPRSSEEDLRDALADIYATGTKFDLIVLDAVNGVIHQPMAEMAAYASATFRPRRDPGGRRRWRRAARGDRGVPDRHPDRQRGRDHRGAVHVRALGVDLRRRGTEAGHAGGLTLAGRCNAICMQVCTERSRSGPRRPTLDA